MNKNVPNIITLSRVILTPIMIVLFLVPIPNAIGKFCAFGIFVIGSLTDMLDGYLARKYNLVSNLGKMLDSIADKFIQTSAIVLVLVTTDIVPTWASTAMLLVIVLRDIWINAIRQIALTNGNAIAADFLGKLKSIFIDIACSILLFYIAMNEIVNSAILNYIMIAGLSIFIVGVGLCIGSAINYSVQNWASVMGKKSE